ncbi:uncharacterized protein LOC126669358 [Mercurialis annua]|uniref:uncharacterized protein LOC126669358 n=1 Tax=Mercurialis annua TaxID=3986 RepID=UPI00215F4C9E|nr:uncharacterized protein LOC126669358 [Mercurialis annua]
MHEQLHQSYYSTKCSGCGGEKRWLLHSVRHRGIYRRLCTDCMLKRHQGLFCPLCFHVYSDDDKRCVIPAVEERLMCLNCPSISHLACAPSSSHPLLFLCPACSSSNFSFFDDNPSSNAIDIDSARALVAAAKISAVAMAKAAAVARVEAERRVQEASLAKKRARDALERFAFLSSAALGNEEQLRNGNGGNKNTSSPQFKRR